MQQEAPPRRSWTGPLRLDDRKVLLLPRLGLVVLLGGGPVELLTLGVGEHIAVAFQEFQMNPGLHPVGAPGRVDNPR